MFHLTPKGGTGALPDFVFATTKLKRSISVRFFSITATTNPIPIHFHTVSTMLQFKSRLLICFLIVLSVGGCSSSPNSRPELRTVDEDGVQVDYTSSVPLTKVKAYHRFLVKIKNKHNFDMGKKQHWLDGGERIKIFSIMDEAILDDPSAIRGTEQIARLASRMAFDCQIIEFHFVNEDYETFRVLKIDPLDHFVAESSVGPSRSTLNGTQRMLLDAVRDGHASDVSAPVDWTGEAMFAIE